MSCARRSDCSETGCGTWRRQLIGALAVVCGLVFGSIALTADQASPWVIPVGPGGKLSLSGAEIPDALLHNSGKQVYRFARAPRLYFENCGGCHGLHGVSVPSNIPTLRGLVGYFTRFPEGRAYLVRVPGVASSPIKDNEDLADLMNFVVRAFGGASVLADFKPYTAAEVAALRVDPLIANLRAYRARLVERLVREYGMPPDADVYAPRPN